MDDDVLLIEKLWGVTRLTLNRPERRNSLSPSLVAALHHTFVALRDDPETRVIVLTGAGDKAFCAGGDLGGDGMFAEAGALAKHDHRKYFADLFRVMAEVGRPIVARLNGHALGGGFGLAMAADLVVAADDVELGAPEINLGLFPMVIMATLSRNIPRKALMELILTGERIKAPEAMALGMLNRVVPRAELDVATDVLVQKLLSKSPAVLRLGRDSFYGMADLDFPRALDYLNNQLTINLMAEDVAEGVSAFFARRPPEWKGR